MKTAKWDQVYYQMILILSYSIVSVKCLSKSELFCLPESSSIIKLHCPMSAATVNVFELRFMINSSCTAGGGLPQQQATCQPRSVRGSDLLECDGNLCSLSQLPLIEMCGGYQANQFYALYECIPVILEKSFVWTRANNSQLTQQLTCPNDSTIVVIQALATVGPLSKPPQCSLQEPFTTQAARACWPQRSSCNVSMTAPGFRCRQHLMKNQHTIVNYSCIPRMELYPEIRKYKLCETTRIEVNSRTSGFIVTPNYPATYPANSQCNMVLASTIPLSLYLLEFDVVYPHSLAIQSNGKKIQLHAKDVLPRRLVSNVTEVTMEFVSNYITSGKCARIYFTNVEPLRPDEYTEHSVLKVVLDSMELIDNYTYGNFDYLQLPKPAMIYGLTIATLALLVSSMGLMFTILCYQRKPFDKENIKNGQNSQRQLLLDYTNQYEELLNSGTTMLHCPCYCHRLVNSRKRNDVPSFIEIPDVHLLH